MRCGSSSKPRGARRGDCILTEIDRGGEKTARQMSPARRAFASIPGCGLATSRKCATSASEDLPVSAHLSGRGRRHPRICRCAPETKTGLLEGRLGNASAPNDTAARSRSSSSHSARRPGVRLAAPLARRLLRRCGAGCGDGCAVRPLRAARATSPSTSAPTSATASAASGGSGARVVALEPQPLCARAIRAIYAGDDGVTLLEAACGEKRRHADAADQLGQSHGLDRLRRFRRRRRRRRRLGGPGVGHGRSRCPAPPSTR